ncbi:MULTISPECIES: hypothetical protein [Rhodococcus]|uniref:hypothetical protein n=1 Tax=Rhodococcus TaxID=1827 RepID=UPI0018DA79B2|nr:hypothetical protein [Rhodococcus qingshengii]QPG87587.1 hypothetical protein I1G86_17155 [Rhodococcus qingshengii]
MATRSEQAHNAAVEVYLDKFADYDKGKWIARTLKFQFTEGLTVSELCALAALAHPYSDESADVADTLRRLVEDGHVSFDADRILRMTK